MKKILIASFIIIVALAAGIGIGIIFKKSSAPVVSDPDKFVWGVTDSAYQVDGYSPAIGARQIGFINDLGINTVRITLERKITLDPFTVTYTDNVNDDFINKLVAAKKDIVLIIDGDIIATSTIPNFDFEAEGKKIGAYAAGRYKGKVKYYQLSNEITGTVVKPSDPNFSGPTIAGNYGLAYSADRYKAALGWLKGMSEGVRANDPQAKLIISGHWILLDAISWLKRDGLDFDILGWAFYDTDGTDITRRDIGNSQTINLAAELSKIGKPLFIIESNASKGSYGNGDLIKGETDQATFLQDFITNIQQTGLFKGFFVYNLFDDPIRAVGGDTSETHWGLVEVKLQNNKPVFRLKKAFTTFRNEIKLAQ